MNLEKLYDLSGPCGLVIVLIGIVAVYISIRNYLYTSFAWKNFKKTFVNTSTNEEKCLKDYQGGNPFLNIIYAMVTTHQQHSDDLRAEVVYLFNKNFRSVTNGLIVLKLITVISPLLGLLGTVLGMLTIFEEISKLSNQDPQILALSIWQALITTVMGLCVAIPTLVMFYLLSMRMKIFLMETIEHTYQAISSFNKVDRRA